MSPGTVKIASGTPGLDDVLHGGFIRGDTAIVSGGPGTGKTILALQFLSAADTTGLYIGFEERERELRRNATALGIDLSDVEILDLSADGERFFSGGSEYSVFTTEEVEGEDLIEQIGASIDIESPDRLVIDPLSELESLLPDGYQFRRNISSLISELKEREITALCTTQPPETGAGRDLQFLGDATIELTRTTDHRSLEVTKFRGSDYASGSHTYRIWAETGAQVYPKLVPGNHLRERPREVLSTTNEGINSLLGGGIERGSVTVISGPSGVGKTTVGSLFLQSAAEQQLPAAGFLFEELKTDYLYRAAQIGLSLQTVHDEGVLRLEEIESLTKSPDEFAHQIRTAVESDGIEVVMIDGVAGYRLGLRGEDTQDQLTRELHALCRYLKRMGVTVILIDEVMTITGDVTATEKQISYLADNIVFMRYLELDGRIEKAVGVLKKRFGSFEQSLRPLTIDTNGVTVGSPLTGFRGVLTGMPERTHTKE